MSASTWDHSTPWVWTLWRAQIKKRLLLTVRYRVNFLGNLVSTYMTFAVLFFGGQAAVYAVGPAGNIGETLSGLVVGWFLYVTAMSAYNGLSRTIASESKRGTLEQLYMTPYGFGRVMSGIVITSVINSLLFGLIALSLALVTAQRPLSLNLLTVLAVVALGLFSICGVGFAFGGLALIYKRIGSIAQLMQYVIIATIAAPLIDVPGAHLVPLGQSSTMLQDAMRRGVRLWEFPPAELGVLVGVAVAYLAVGYVVFRVCSRVARRRGVMGEY